MGSAASFSPCKVLPLLAHIIDDEQDKYFEVMPPSGPRKYWTRRSSRCPTAGSNCRTVRARQLAQGTIGKQRRVALSLVG
jgi:hypothetical protein